MKKKLCVVAIGLLVVNLISACSTGKESDAQSTENSAKMESDTEISDTLEGFADESSHSESMETTISFRDFKDGDYYRYAQIPWNTPKEELDEMIDAGVMELYQEFERVKIYRSFETVKVIETGEEAFIEMEYKDNKLQLMNLIMEEPNENIRKAKYAKVKEELRKLYGEEDSENTMEGIEVIKWLSEKEGERTTLQVGNDERGIVRIVLGIIQ